MSTGLVREAFGEDNLPTGIAEQIGRAAHRLDEIANEMSKAKAEDSTRYEELRKEQVAQAATLGELKKAAESEEREAQVKAALDTAAEWRQFAASYRSPSKAGLIGTGSAFYAPQPAKAGAFLGAVMAVKSGDWEAQKAAKATLQALGSGWTDVPTDSKATLGTTDALGGWIVPNALVDSLIKPATYANPYRRLVTTVSGVVAPSIDIPFRRNAPNRAVVAPWGDAKENVDLVYEGYTATMYTIARVHDLSKQFARQSQGAAEQDVLQELATAFALGEAFYITQGTGTGQPYGLQTALALGGAAAFTSAFTPGSTLVGSVAAAIATAAGALAGRNEPVTAAVLAATSYWTMLSQGTDEAGFWFAGSRQGGTPEGIDPTTLISPFGVPVYPDSSSLAGTDDLIVGNWKALKVYFGESYRVDSSDVAGNRWDNNLIGFRGEEEIGLDARPAVFAGKFQFVADVIP